MFTALLGQWRFSQAHIIGWHSLTLNVLIVSEFMVGEDCVPFITQKHYINSWLT